MPAMATLYESISDDLKKVCRIIDHELFSDMPVINELFSHVRHYRGKMLRPALLLLSAESCGGINQDHLTLAAVVEIIHIATLVHDDVLDEAELRRRCPTINCLQGNEAAVLLGDYLISHAFYLCNDIDSQFASRKIGATTNAICEGELQQVYHRGDNGLSAEQYVDIIARKTASMIGTCCFLGAHYNNAGSEIEEALERYGLGLGIAFQITDDVLDIIGSEESMGKTLGRDLEKRKLTLPVIHCLARADKEVHGELKTLLSQRPYDRHRIQELLESTDSINYSLKTARQHVDAAIQSLAVLPPGEARDTLSRMASMIIEREQ